MNGLIFLCLDLTRASTAQATVWMGCQCGRLYIHSAVLHWKKPLHVVKLPDAVLSIMCVDLLYCLIPLVFLQ